MQEGITITLSKEKSEEYFYNALCNGVGTGYIQNYGIELVCDDQDYHAAKTKLKAAKPNTVVSFEDVWMQVLRDGKTLKILDSEKNEDDAIITLADVHERVSKSQISSLIDMMTENDDAETASVIIQTVFYGEIIFG